MAKAPTKVTIRTYDVGFGDCFLLSFKYDAAAERHVLIDFGSTGLPPDAPKTRMTDIAEDIKKRVKTAPLAVVATHRHKDHISGFETKKGGKGSGDIIAALKPKIVVQPWTEDPDLAPTATGPKGAQSLTGAQKRIAALASMHNVARQALAESKRTRFFPKALKDQLSFLGEDNIANRSAVDNLMNMARNVYAFCGSKSGLENHLPGVRVHVLGPPTVKQTDTIKKMRSKDADEFWHLQATRMNLAGADGAVTGLAAGALFPRHVRSQGPSFPIDARWLIYHARALKGDQLLQIVRMLDDQMNNTSLILLFEIGNKKLLFPGDAQLENWQFALGKDEYKKLLAGVNLYKVGHHGSLNATPKSLWALFKNRSTDSGDGRRLQSLMSTMEGKHGSRANETEVPRRPLVQALKRESELFSTEDLATGKFFHDTVL